MHRSKSIKFLYRNYELVIFISMVILPLILKCYSKMLFILQLFYLIVLKKQSVRDFVIFLVTFLWKGGIGVY